MDFFGWLASDRRRAYAAFACLAAIGLPLHIYIKGSSDRAPLAENRLAPAALQGPTLAGGEYDSVNDRGRLVVLAFLDLDSAPSAQQADAVAVWRKTFADGHAAFVVVLAEAPPEKLAAFADAHGLPRDTVVVDRGGTRRQPFRVSSAPAIVMIDPMGLVRVAHIGLVPSDDPGFREAMNGFLNQTMRLPLPLPPPAPRTP